MNTRLNKNGDVPERLIHLTVMDFIRQFPEVSKYVLHFPNESKRTLSYGKLLKDMGMRKGVADLFIALPRRGYNGAWIEIKNEKGRLSVEQNIFLNDMACENYFTAVTRGVDETINTIHWYCFK